MSDAVHRLSAWYQSQCNGEWEHGWAVSIQTLDNPGWLVTVNLVGTTLDNAEFEPVITDRSPTSWVNCSVQMRARAKGDTPTRTFVGAGGSENLDEILTKFCDWAEQHAGAARRPGRR